VKEKGLEDMLLNMYKHDFNENPVSSPDADSSKWYSYEDKRCLKLMQEEC